MSYYTSGRHYYPPLVHRGEAISSSKPTEKKSVIGPGLVIIGVIQILVGLLTALVAVYRLVASCQLASMATGTWVGGVIMILGVLAIIAGLSRDEKSLTTVTVLSFLSMILSIVMLSIEGVALNREIISCDPNVNACQPLCFFSSNNLVFIGFFEFSFCFAIAIMAIKATRKASSTSQAFQNRVEPLPRWAIPSIYEMDPRLYHDEILARGLAVGPLPALPSPHRVQRYDHSTQTNVPRYDEDRYRFP